ncbi:MAG: tetratricopeptide repeat protein, partial [Bacteroidia bacterium]
INETSNDKVGLALTYNDIGVLYHKQGNFSKGLFFYKKSAEIIEKSGDQVGMARSLNNIAGIYQSSGDNDKALDFYLRSLQILEKIDFKRGFVPTLNNIATIYLDKKEYKAAEEYALRSYNMAKELDSPQGLLNASDKLARIYNATGRYKEAFDMHVIFKQMTDKINNEDAQRATLQFDFNKKAEVAKAEQKQRDEINAREKQKQRIITFAVSFGLLIVLIFSVVLLNRYRLIQKQKQIIEEQKRLVEDKQKDILDSITYAKRIQTSLLPMEKYIAKYLNREERPK